MSLLAAVVLGAVLVAAGCGRCYGPFGRGHPCVDETDCIPGLACAVGFCLDPEDAGLGEDANFPASCGDGILEPPEICDDGNNNDSDECSAECDQVFGLDVLNQIFSNQADILFVLDNSGSMCEEQINLRASFQSFIDGLTAFADVDFHIGVITTDTMDFGESGTLQNEPRPIINDEDCMVALPPPQDCTTGLPFPLPRILTPNTVDLARTFRCIAQVGIDGFGGESALAAVELALSPPLITSGLNAGFLRPDSLLAVLFVGDEDDCSVCNDPNWPGQCQFMPSITQNLDCSIWQNEFLTPVDTFVTEMMMRRPEGRIFGAAIIGLDADGSSEGPVFPDPDTTNHPDELFPICESVAGRAAPAPRIEAYARSFEPLARVASICQEDFSPALLEMGMAIGNELLNAKCLSKPPCPGITREEIRVEVSTGTDIYVLDPSEYTLRFEDSCPGDYQMIFTIAPPEGAIVSIYYPAMSEDGLGCIGYGSN